ncbi:MAG: proteasome assembly chaperone family protein [Candidatus Heimdallarchaeota archaeon]|nr:proteasome assembly chaperone family protein [Candidatus Heimdallarchaeota archaeon]
MMIENYTDINPGSQLVLGFPTVGMVSSILSDFMINQLNLEVVGAVSLEDNEPVTLIQNGKPVPAIQIFTDKVQKSGITIMSSAIPIEGKFIGELSSAIIEWAKKNQISRIITIDGIPAQPRPDGSQPMYHIGSTDEVLTSLESISTSPLQAGFITGLSGAVILKASKDNFPVVGLLVGANQNLPDFSSAIEVSSVFKELNPDLELDLSILHEKYDELKAQAQQYMIEAQNVQQKPKFADMYA